MDTKVLVHPKMKQIHAFSSFLKSDFWKAVYSEIRQNRLHIETPYNINFLWVYIALKVIYIHWLKEKYQPSNIEEHIHMVKVLGQGLHLVFLGNINNFGFDT